MKVPIARTHLTEKEFTIIRKPLESGWVVQGPYVEEFENKWSSFTGSKHSISVTSCTTALHLSLDALGLKPKDEVIKTILEMTRQSHHNASVLNLAKHRKERKADGTNYRKSNS